jgi:hypothetical protein
VGTAARRLHRQSEHRRRFDALGRARTTSARWSPRFNTEVAAAGHGDSALEERPAKDGLNRAGGIVVSDEGAVIIQIGEYAPGGARVVGKFGSVSYQFVK